ncbi:MAG: hypothetical protein QME81_05470 [bacterium]|nr:hypothetical protein [bacterium]
MSKNPRFLLHPFFVGGLVLLLVAGCSVFSGGGKKEGPETLPSPVEPPQPGPVAPVSKEMPETEKLDFIVKTVNGSLNWSKGLVSAKGYGVPPADAPTPEVARLLAFQAAKIEAQANLLEITAGVHITATSTVKDYMVKDRVIETKVEGILKGAKEIKMEFLEKEQMAVVEVAVFLEEVGGAIPKKAISPSSPQQLPLKFASLESSQNPTLTPFIGDNAEVINAVRSGRNLDEVQQSLNNMAQKDEKLLAILATLMQEIDLLKKSQTTPVEPEVEYTGIVVNAAGSGITPHMKPNIYTQAKDAASLFYGIGDGRQRDPNLHALAAWEQTLTGATDNSRVAQTPFVVKAASVSDDKKSLAISQEAARKIEEIEQKYHLLERGRVVIVL